MCTNKNPATEFLTTFTNISQRRRITWYFFLPCDINFKKRNPRWKEDFVRWNEDNMKRNDIVCAFFLPLIVNGTFGRIDVRTKHALLGCEKDADVIQNISVS